VCCARCECLQGAHAHMQLQPSLWPCLMRCNCVTLVTDTKRHPLQFASVVGQQVARSAGLVAA
jgi:hypothetical protein